MFNPLSLTLLILLFFTYFSGLGALYFTFEQDKLNRPPYYKTPVHKALDFIAFILYPISIPLIILYFFSKDFIIDPILNYSPKNDKLH